MKKLFLIIPIILISCKPEQTCVQKARDLDVSFVLCESNKGQKRVAEAHEVYINQKYEDNFKKLDEIIAGDATCDNRLKQCEATLIECKDIITVEGIVEETTETQ